MVLVSVLVHQDSDMEESDEEEEGRRIPMSPPPLPAVPGSDAAPLPPPLPPLGDVPIRKNYDPKGLADKTASK